MILPKTLEIALKNLLEEHNLSGWSIHGSQKITTLVLRFNMEDHIQNQDIKYKRVSPSQLNRDKDRYQQKNPNTEDTSIQTVEKTSEDLQPTTSDFQINEEMDTATTKFNNNNIEQALPRQLRSSPSPAQESHVAKATQEWLISRPYLKWMVILNKWIVPLQTNQYLIIHNHLKTNCYQRLWRHRLC